jgi:hypothetical protein
MGGKTRSGAAPLSSSPAPRRHDLPPPSRTGTPSTGIAHHRLSPRLGDAGVASPPSSRKAAEYEDGALTCQFAPAANPNHSVPLSPSAHFSRVNPVSCAQLQRKSRFSPPNRPTTHQNRKPFQWLGLEIRYLADQRNFSPDQRIKAARTSEYQWNSAAAQNTPNWRESTS